MMVKFGTLKANFQNVLLEPLYVMYFMSAVQFVFQGLQKGEVFYDVATNELQILRERERD